MKCLKHTLSINHDTRRTILLVPRCSKVRGVHHSNAELVMSQRYGNKAVQVQLPQQDGTSIKIRLVQGRSRSLLSSTKLISTGGFSLHKVEFNCRQLHCCSVQVSLLTFVNIRFQVSSTSVAMNRLHTVGNMQAESLVQNRATLSRCEVKQLEQILNTGHKRSSLDVISCTESTKPLALSYGSLQKNSGVIQLVYFGFLVTLTLLVSSVNPVYTYQPIKNSGVQIVKRGQKLTVEKFGGHHQSCSHTSHSVHKFHRFWQRGMNPPPPPLPK